ncbi:MAG TPA: biopolymer transporter ExbD [Bacteroidetes bacterium]|nr:biopolymer transporter ExbD [Bacteroidota bacterium]
MMLENRRKRDSGIPTSSLADIAFLLLTFFLVTTTIDVDKGLGLTLPPKGEKIEIRQKNITNLLINVQGQVLIDGEATQIPMVKDVIIRKLIENPKLIVSLKTDRETKYNVYIQVLDRVKQAMIAQIGTTRISLAEPEQS